MKDKGFNLRMMIIILKFVVSCDNLGLKEPFQGTYFGHAMLKVCQYGITYEKVFVGLHEVSIESSHANIKKCIIWPKKSRKEFHEWTKKCIEHTYDNNMMHPYSYLFHDVNL